MKHEEIFIPTNTDTDYSVNTWSDGDYEWHFKENVLPVQSVYVLTEDELREIIIKARCTAPILPTIDSKEYKLEAVEYFNRKFITK